MAKTAANYEQQMQNIQGRLKKYTPTNIGDVTSDFMKRVGNFAPQYAEQRGMQAQAYKALPEMMSQYAQRYGEGGGIGPSAFNMLSSGMGEVGRQMGTADVLGDVIGRAGGRIENLAQSALGQYRAVQNALQQRYQMLQPLYQAAEAREEAERQRAFQAAEAAKARAAARSRGGGGMGRINIPMRSGGGQQSISANEALNILATIPTHGMTKEERKSIADKIMARVSGNIPSALAAQMYNAAGFSNKWNPTLNTTWY